MNKRTEFDGMDLGSDFGDDTAFEDFDMEDDPKDVGKRRLKNAAVITLDRITAKDQVRQDFDDEEHKKLVASLKEHGQQQPIRVRWFADEEKWIIIQGERRYRAARDAGLSELECVIEDAELSEAQIIERQIVENTHRKQLGAVEEARAYKRLMDLQRCPAVDVAKQLGVSANTVQRSVRLLKLPADILADVQAGTLPKSVIVEVQKLKNEDSQRTLIADYKQSGSLVDVAQKVHAKKTGTKPKSPPKTKKRATVNGISLQATAKKKIALADVAAALRTWAEQIEEDGRSSGKQAA